MSVAVIVIFSLIAIVPVWGVISPRNQWRILTGWSERDPGSHEPGTLAVGIHRTVAGLAIAATVVAVVAIHQPATHALASPSEPTITEVIRERWGAPDPVVVNRVFNTATEEPADLTKVASLRYQAVAGAHRDPTYLFALKNYSRPDASANDGYIGTDPRVGMTALDSANLVVQVRADSRCTPQQVLVVESATSVVVAIYYGLPVAGGTRVALAPCDPAATGSAATSQLIPIHLTQPLGTRNVVDVDGAPVADAVTAQTVIAPTPTPTPTAPRS